jgi:5-methylcytosine-specific restriction endonuclease McrA
MVKESIRKLIERRDSACFHCGSSQDLVIHHRRNRGMGGSKLLDTPDNLMTVCSAYNGEMESSPRVAQQARAWNHKLPVWESQNLPVFDRLGGWWYLHPDGTKELSTWSDAAF